MKKKILVWSMVVALVATLVVPTAAMADNEAEQTATTTYAATILIRDIANAADVTTITFPAAASGTEVVNPTSNIPETQILTAVAADATPVAILTSDTSYNIWYTITDTVNWDETVVDENLLTIAIDETLDKTTFDTNAHTITVWDTPSDSTQPIVSGVNLELYLTVTLETATGQVGTSTLTILGES